MTCKINIEHSFTINQWRDFINCDFSHKIFYTPEFYKIYSQVKYLKPLLFSVQDNQDGLKGLALGEVSDELFSFWGLTRHTTFYTEPLYIKKLDVLEDLLQQIKSKYQGLFVEIRLSRVLTFDEKSVYETNGFIFKDHLNSLIPITSEDDIWKNLSRDKQDGILKAQKNGIKLIENNTVEGVNIFYYLLNDLFKRKRHFMKHKEFYLQLLNHSNFHYLFAYYNNKPIATQLYYIYNNTLTAYYTATHRDYTSKHAGDLLVWKMLQTAVKEKCERFDFGGGGNPNKFNGSREYKKGFGAQFQNVGRYIYSRNNLYPFLESIYSSILKT